MCEAGDILNRAAGKPGVFPGGAARVIAEERDFLVCFKPSGTHTAPLKKGGLPGETLLETAARDFPEIMRVRGKNGWEGGLLHRLDRETEGLVLIARTQDFLDRLLDFQVRGLFVKKYSALSAGAAQKLPGFPLFPGKGQKTGETFPASPFTPQAVESGFRAWGPGRKAVRPVIPAAEGRPLYRTEILLAENAGSLRRFSLELRRGFRHQIRCHLAWAGWPVLNDALYGGSPAGGRSAPEYSGENAPWIALRAEEIRFPGPAGKDQVVSLNPSAPRPRCRG